MKSYIPQDSYGIDLRNYGPPRTSGVHLSSILRHIALSTGELAKEYGTGPTISSLIRDNHPCNARSIGSIVKCAIGFSWESWLAPFIPNLDHQPCELVHDGIIATPDGIDINNVIHEFKATWKSSAYPATDQLMWIWQVMGYCYMLSMTIGIPCLTAVIHPVYLCGDYRGNRDPVYRPTVIEFEEQELEINWRMVMDNKYQVMPEVW